MNVGVRLAMVVLAVIATCIGLAAPAIAGCEQRPLVGYCDAPIQPDGSWKRCFSNTPRWNREIGT